MATHNFRTNMECISTGKRPARPHLQRPSYKEVAVFIFAVGLLGVIALWAGGAGPATHADFLASTQYLEKSPQMEYARLRAAQHLRRIHRGSSERAERELQCSTHRRAFVWHAHDKVYFCSALVSAVSAMRAHEVELPTGNEYRASAPDTDTEYVIMVSQSGNSTLSCAMRSSAEQFSIRIIVVPPYPMPNRAKCDMGRYSHSLERLYIAGLVEYCKVVFVDSDTVVLRSLHDAFAFPHLSSVQDPVGAAFGAQSSMSGAFHVTVPSHEFDRALRAFVMGWTACDSFHEMEILNEFANRELDNEWTEIPRYYMAINWMWQFKGLSDPKRQNSLIGAVRAIHFSSPKPWAVARFWNRIPADASAGAYQLWRHISTEVC